MSSGVMCHHVDMAIDWDEVVTEEQDESLTESSDTAAADPEVDAEQSPLEAAPPADD